MRTVTYKLDDLKKVAISIGRADENEATRVQIDAGQLFAEYPAAVPAMKVISPAGVTYSREVTRDGDLVVWDVVDSDLAAEGYGEMQLTFTENSVKVKSAIAQIRVCRSIVGEGTAPDPVQDWLDEAEDVLEDVEEALGAFPTGGTTGQVLAKKSNTDYDTEWVDQGSGGTTDYTELTNKPQIGGVTLTGDKSLSDLGAASAADVSAKYTKPPGGIPASDIAAGVIPDPTSIIDDTAGDGDTNKVWSADKTDAELADVKSAITQEENDIDSIENRLLHVDGIPKFDWVLGRYTINSQTHAIVWQTIDYNITLKGNGIVKLNVGDVLSADSGCEFYLAYSVEGNSTYWYDLAQWRTSYTIADAGYYAIKLRDSEHTTDPIQNIATLSGKFHLTTNSDLFDRVGKIESINAEKRIGDLEGSVDGKYSISSKIYPAGNAFQDIITGIDIKAGCTIAWNLTLTQTPPATVYGYFIDENNNYVESTGSLFGITTSKTSNTNTKTFTQDHKNVRFALKASQGCSMSFATITESNGFIKDELKTIAGKTNQIDLLRQRVFEVTGISEIENVDFPAGTQFNVLYTIDLKAGITYTVSVELNESVRTVNTYAYLLDQNGNYVGESGSLFGIPPSSTSNSKNVTLATSYEKLRFAVKNTDNNFSVKDASITFTPVDNGGFEVPDYYMANNYLNNKIARINELAESAGADGDVFLFITDEHLTQNAYHSPALIRYVSERINVKRMFDGGDGVNTGSLDYAKTMRKAFNGKVHFCMGNHEWFGNQTGDALYYIYDSVNGDQVGNNDRHYYYVDDEQTKTRYIVMSAFAEMTGSSGADPGFEADQITWLTNTALNVQSGWTIILFAHGVFYGQWSDHTWVLMNHAQNFVNALDNYSGNGKIAFVMQGHLHADGINYTPGGIPVIATTCDKQGHWISSDVDMEEFLAPRVVGTTTEQAFDVVVHNKRTKTIYCVRIGGFATFNSEGVEELLEAGERVITYT